ncbi:sorting nexin [Plakobranchus ocellatus]|uniref:Sorting nexin n=1 Tax=Plakobranchus ocellatus TaxID=259542 RepID=A0AAV4DM30_9GAST|nr:sorting nexin [Plakobranchus ocellatus]
MFAGTAIANRNLLPPFVVYKGQHLYLASASSSSSKPSSAASSSTPQKAKSNSDTVTVTRQRTLTDSGEDDIPLGVLRGIRDLVEYKRFSGKNDNIITKTFNKALPKSVTMDNRGRHSKRLTDEVSVNQFIERYHPAISHYSRGKTPIRRCLPNDLTLTDIHRKYVSTHVNISYSAFYKVFKTMRISISSLGNEECDILTALSPSINETISELGKNGKDTAVLWHEAISGRRDEDIASAFHAYIGSLRDTEKLTMWLDNCSGQKKKQKKK